jgi:nicotinamide-nucleotide amidase
VNACIVAVGSELLTPLRTDTNSLRITERLNEVGFDVSVKVVVGDEAGNLARVVAGELSAVDLLICTGGLGPTDDDVTRDAIAQVTNRPLEFHADILERIRQRFARRNLNMPDINRRQAMVPRGATVIENRNGTAPGLWLEHGGKPIVLLPGPPREMAPMLESVITEYLEPRSSGARVLRRVLKITGRTESDVDATAQPIYGPWRHQPIPITTTILAALGQIELHLMSCVVDRSAGSAALDRAVGQLQATLGPSVYSTDGRPLEAVVGDLLREAKWTIAAAESCTGGLLTSRLTDVPGSSDYVQAAAICYSNTAKVEWVGIDDRLIEEHGAVSEPVARGMAEQIRIRARTDVGVGITGIAGPGGGTPAKPVGTVAIAVAIPETTEARTFHFIGHREQVKFQATQAAMNMLRLMMTRTGSRSG